MKKYKNKFCTVDGIKFDSQREAKRWQDLQLLANADEITGLTRQVPFVLAKAHKFTGEKRTTPAIRFIADFVYTDVKQGKIVVEDVKSPITAKLAAFRLKRHLMASVHGIEVKVTM